MNLDAIVVVRGAHDAGARLLRSGRDYVITSFMVLYALHDGVLNQIV